MPAAVAHHPTSTSRTLLLNLLPVFAAAGPPMQTCAVLCSCRLDVQPVHAACLFCCISICAGNVTMCLNQLCLLHCKFRIGPCAGYMERYNKSHARTATEEYVKVAEKHGLTPTQLALAWCRCGRSYRNLQVFMHPFLAGAGKWLCWDAEWCAGPHPIAVATNLAQ
jgi:hypothetical protein